MKPAVIFEQAEARVLFYSWHMTAQDKRKEWLKNMLARAEKIYGAGAGERIRKYMTQLRLESEALQTIPPSDI